MPAAERGRSTRGAARRDALVQAAVDLLAQRGFAAVSHRAVAQHAGLPLAATTYYFASLDALLEAAVRRLAAQWSEAARAALDELPRRLGGPREAAEAAVAIAVPAGDDLYAVYDRYLEAGRSDALRPLVAEYDAVLDGLLAEVLERAGHPGDRAPLLLAVVDGASLRALAEGLPPRRAAVDAVERLLELGAP